MHLSEGIIEHFIQEVEKGEKMYAQLSHDGYAKEIFRRLKEKYPETVMVEYKDYIFIAFTKEGKERIRERIRPFIETVSKEAEELKKCMEELGGEKSWDICGLKKWS